MRTYDMIRYLCDKHLIAGQDIQCVWLWDHTNLSLTWCNVQAIEMTEKGLTTSMFIQLR